MTINQIEEAMEIACDDICRFPEMFKDPDELIDRECNECPLRQFLDTLEEE